MATGSSFSIIQIKDFTCWHDIPLHLGGGVFNFIVEIPKEASVKMEVATDEYYPYSINWNYGLLPQTWEDPSLANAVVKGALEIMIQLMLLRILGKAEPKLGKC